MSRILLSIAVLLLLGNMIFAQSKISFGINADVAIPTGEFSNNYKVGFGGGFLALIKTSSPNLGVVLGASYENFPGKTVTETNSGPGWWETVTTTYLATNLVSFYAGSQIGKEKGPYFLPAISLNVNEGETRFGLDIGAGFLAPLGTGKTKLNVGSKYSIINLVGKQEGEETASGIRIFLGILI